MDDPNFKHNYQKYKYRVKVWETKFRKEKGRVPSKYDIREAPEDIRAAYKMYYKMKTNILENTLSEVLCEDGFDIGLDNSQGETLSSQISMEGISYLADCESINLPSTEELLNISNAQTVTVEKSSSNNEIDSRVQLRIRKDFNAVDTLEHNLHAWNNISNQKKKENIESSNNDKHRTSLPTKLLKVSSFSKRNPRKSIPRLPSASLSKAPSNLSFNINETKDDLPDLETILLQKSQQQQQQQSKDNFPSGSIISISKHIVTNINSEWLTRCGSNDSRETPLIEKRQDKQTTSYGISNINIENITKHQPTSLEAVSGTSSNTSFGLSGLNLNSNKTTPVIPTVPPVPPKTFAQNSYENGSDSVVSNSEDESTTAKSVSVRHIIKKRRVLEDINKNENNEQNETPKEIKQKKQIEPKSDNIILENKTSVSKPRRRSKKEKKNLEEYSDSNDESYSPTKKRKPSKSTKDRKQPKRKSTTNLTKTNKQSTTSKRISNQTKKSLRKTAIEAEKSDMAPVECNLDPLALQYDIIINSNRLNSLPSTDSKELKLAENLVHDYIKNNNAEALTKVKKGIPTTAEEDTSKENRKSKKLNENFVRLNMKKKVFVRGKKTINFSKYKKTLWRQKKAAALTGPDMDMKGCDGGFLLCFKCGKQGHFARNCKIQSDNLLPIDAVEEDSPFPTLEEAKQMARDRAIVAHRTNIGKLPEVSNMGLLEGSSSTEVAVITNEQIENTDNKFETEIDLQKEEIVPEQDDTEDITPTQSQSSSNNSHPNYIGHKIPEEFLRKSGLLDVDVASEHGVEPLYQCDNDGSVIDTTTEVYEALRMFGHTSFRKGQDRAIMRILSGISTLVTLSTGSGKSLCYQLPAYLYNKRKKCTTLVVSPLVSLMEDQVHGVPMFLNAQCLHTNQTPQQKEKIMQMARNGELDILLVSPEAVVAGERSTGFGALFRQLPPIAFACIDEVHCVSQWSHNFRPSYMMICKVLKQKLGVKTILGLTATATLTTKHSIVSHLEIPDGINGIVSDISLPQNLVLSISKDENRDQALIALLRSERFAACQSIIVYCTRRDECERIAGYIRTCLQDLKAPENTKKRKRINWNAEPYHAGMAASRRRTIQNAFMKNDLRIVVATIAFGMGINKPDIRGIIHYNMPRSFESYVQEVGRAGRDGNISHCHLFLNSKGTDESELRRHIYANSIDRHVIRKLLQKVFVPCSCKNNFKKKDFVDEHRTEIDAICDIDWTKDFQDEQSVIPVVKATKRLCPGHEVCFSIEETVQQLDIPSENISTLLCYLELENRWFVHVLSNAYTMCKLMSYNGAKDIKRAAKECPALAMAIAVELKNGRLDENSAVVEFPVVSIASAIGWDSGVVKHQLKNLEWTTVNGLPKRSSISVSFFDLGFRIRAPGDLTDDELDETLDFLYHRAVHQEKTQLYQLNCLAKGLELVAYPSYRPCAVKHFDTERSDKIKRIIEVYLQDDLPQEIEIQEEVNKRNDRGIIDDVHTMISMYPENNFTGRNLARIFHGIQSPNYPAIIWGRCKFWRAYSNTDFNYIIQLANSVIVQMRT